VYRTNKNINIRKENMPLEPQQLEAEQEQGYVTPQLGVSVLMQDEALDVPSSSSTLSFDIPELEGIFDKPVLTKDEESDRAKQFAYAYKNLGQEVTISDVKDKVVGSSIEGVRAEIEREKSSKEFEASKAEYEKKLGDPFVTPDQLADDLQGLLKQSEQLLYVEDAVVDYSYDNLRKDPEWREILDSSPELEATVRVDAKKQLLLQNKLALYRSSAEERGLFTKARDMAASFLTPLDYLSSVFGSGAINYADRLDEFGKKYNAAQTVAEADSILKEFEEEVLSAYVLINNKEWELDQLELAFRGGREDIALANSLGGIEAITTLMGWSSVVKGASKMYRKTEDVNEISQKLGDTDSIAKNLDPVENVHEATAQTISLRIFDDESLSAHPKIKEELELNQRILSHSLDNMPEVTKETFLDTENMQKLRKAVLDSNPKAFTDVSIGATKVLPDGSMNIDLYTQKGNPYKTERAAEARLKKLGLGGTVVPSPNGGYLARAELELDAFNYIKGFEPKAISTVRRMIDNIDNWVDPEIVAKGRLAEGGTNTLEDSVQSIYKRTFAKLNNQQRTNLSRVLQKQQDDITESVDNKTWWTTSQFETEFRKLTGVPPTEKELKAALAYRQLNDFMYNLDNGAIYKSLKSNNFNKLKHETIPEGVNGKLSNREAALNNAVYDPVTRTTYSKGTVPEEVLERSDVYRVHPNSIDSFMALDHMAEGAANVLVLPKGAGKLDALDVQQLPYLAGGRRMYPKDTIFIKQANIGQYADGNSYRLRDKAIYTADTMSEAKEFITKYNSGLKIARELKGGSLTPERAREMFNELEDMGTLDDFLDDINAKGVDINQDLQALRDREVIDLSNNKNITADFGEDMNIFQSVGNRFNKRGSGLTHFDGTRAKMLDPFESMSRSFDMASQNASLGIFKEFSLERFKTMFGKYLVAGKETSLINLIDSGVTPAARKAGLEATIRGHQQFIKEILGHQTTSDILYKKRVESIAETFTSGTGSKILGAFGVSKQARKNAQLKTQEMLDSPTGKLRSMVFNAKLGMFNPASFIIQTLHAPVIVGMSPKYGMKSLSTYWPIRAALIAEDPAVIKEIAKRANKAGDDFKGLGDFEEIVSEFKSLGFNNFGGNLAYIDAANGSNALTGGRANKLLDDGKFFFEEGERIPRIVAYMVARQKWLSKVDKDPRGKVINPKGKPATSDEGREWISNETHRLTLGMSRIDLQQITKGGVKGLITQFMSYPMRASAAFFGEQFTKAEKAGMAMAYLGLYGTASFPFLDLAADHALGNANSPADLDKDALDKLIYNGVPDAIMEAAFDIDTNLAARGGLGAFWHDIYEKLIDKPSIDIGTGAALQTANRGLDTFVDIARAFSAMNNPQIDTLSEAALMSIGTQISSFNNAYKAYIGWNTATLYDTYGRKLAPMSKNELIANILGFPPQAYEDISKGFRLEDKRKVIIKNGTEDILRLHDKYFSATSPSEKEEILEYIKMRYLAFDKDGLAKEITQNVSREYKSKNLLESMVLRQQQYVRPEEIKIEEDK
jgi:AraC-like DNA-binding protein